MEAEASCDRPEPVAIDTGPDRVGVGEEPGHAAVSVQEGVDPGEAMVRGRRGDQALQPRMTGRAVGLLAASERGGTEALAGATCSTIIWTSRGELARDDPGALTFAATGDPEELLE